MDYIVLVTLPRVGTQSITQSGPLPAVGDTLTIVVAEPEERVTWRITGQVAVVSPTRAVVLERLTIVEA